jgi:uncharacterized YigZ family protein
MNYQIPAEEIRNEITVAKSRFITTLTQAVSVEEARSFIARIRDEFSGATHNVPAYIIGYGSSIISHCSDNGEPPGTAGKPVLSVLNGSDIGDVAIVVTRYFGGTKLGTGGLVRAYTEAAKSAVDIVPRAIKIPTYTLMIGAPYSLLELIRLKINEHEGNILEEVFGSEVTLSARLPEDKLVNFQKILRNLSRGELEVVILDKKVTIQPLKKD